MRRWKRRVRTSVMRWRDRDPMYGFTNTREAGHVGSITINYLYDGSLRNVYFMPKVNMTTLEAESAS